MIVPSFADRIAPVPITHNPRAFFLLSLLSLSANMALTVYQFIIIRKRRLNPLKDDLYKETSAYRSVLSEV